MVLSLQGCMAAGKTTAARYLQAHAPGLHVCLEDNAQVIAEVSRRGLDKSKFEDHLEIQRLWIRHEIERYREAEKHPCAVMDLGAEEIEFYTLHYPLSIGERWPVADALQKELAGLRECMPERILFLDASEQLLRRHKQADTARSREFFEYSLTRLLPLKKQWFLARPDFDNLDLLRVEDLDAEEVGRRVLAWVDYWRRGGAAGAAAPWA